MVPIFLLFGCGKPNSANITLRKENQSLRDQVEQLLRTHEADQATIRSLQKDMPTVEILPEPRIATLYTTHGIRLKRLTGGADTDPARPGDDAIKVYVEPFDEDGHALKAAGSVLVEAFDLSSGGKQVGRWEFDTSATRKSWHAGGLLYEYVLTCPLDQPPQHPELTLKVTFDDELTRRQFTAQQTVKVELPASSSSAVAK